MVRSRFEAPNTVWINKRLKSQEPRLKYELAFFAGHRMMHNGDGLISPHEATWNEVAEAAAGGTSMGPQDVLYAWRDFECGSFAAALLCPRAPFRRFLIREAHSVEAGSRLGVTSAVMMRRMTSVSPYRHWHFFDAYPPGFLRAVYRTTALGQHECGSRPVPTLGRLPVTAQYRKCRHRKGGAQAEISDLDHAGR
jgi:hypothetical protein